jgi:hypothetical protein
MSTRPVPKPSKGVSFEAHCAALGVDLNDARQATLARTLWWLVSADPIGAALRRADGSEKKTIADCDENP